MLKLLFIVVEECLMLDLNVAACAKLEPWQLVLNWNTGS
jgi:hypothetical protein